MRRGSGPPPGARIVAIRPGALGDTLLIFPALALIREAWPEAHMTLVARRDVLPLARAWGLADAVSSYDAPEWSALFAEAPPADCSLRAAVAGRVVVAWLADTDGGVTANLTAMEARQVVIGPGRPRVDVGEHAALQLAAPLREMDIAVPCDVAALPMPGSRAGMPALPYREVDVASMSGLVEQGMGTVALHPGSGGAGKRWPPERFAALAQEIGARGLRALLIEGPQDEAVIGATLAEAARRGTRPDVARGLDIMELAALLAGCAAYVGNDSGVSHLAGILGVRTLALFGPSDPAIWAPVGSHARALCAATGAMDGLSVAAVAAALDEARAG